MQPGSGISDNAKQRTQNKMAEITHHQPHVNKADNLIGPFQQSEDTINEIIEMTEVIPLFDKIESVQVGIFAAHMRITHLDEKQRLFAEGEDSDYMCFVVSGTLEVFKQSHNGRTVSVSTLSRGRAIGEMALMDSYPRSATVIAQTPCTLLKITRKSFDHMLDKRPRAGISFLKSLSKALSLQLRKTSGQLADACGATGSSGIIPVLKDNTARSVADKTTQQPKLIDHIINRKQSNLPPFIRQFI